LPVICLRRTSALAVDKTGCSSLMANWLSNFLASLTFLSLLKGLGDVATFPLYAALSLAGLLFCFRFVPETKGVPLEIIERNLRAGHPLRDLGKGS
jgi:MFS transporter, SP family, galactose:H+ symporter